MLNNETKQNPAAEDEYHKQHKAILANMTHVMQQYFHVDESIRKKPPLPAWLDHFNAKDLKILIKCSVAAWILTVFIVINATLRIIGQAAFFACLIIFMVPPSGVVFIYLMSGMTVIIGLCLGWAWGSITMKAALTTRPAHDLRAQYLALQHSAPRNTTNASQYSGQTQWSQIAVYEGFMLDSRVSITYFCMLSIFIYFMSRLRVAVPKFALVSIFATILTSIYFTIAPLIPTFQGTLPKVLAIPSALAIAIGAVCNILLFPQSASHVVLDAIKDVVAPMAAVMRATDHKFGYPEARLDVTSLSAIQMKVAAAFANLGRTATFLPMDISVGRWSADDAGSLKFPVRKVLLAFLGIVQLHSAHEEHIVKNEELSQIAQTLYESDETLQVGHYQIHKTINYRIKLRHPETQNMILKSYDALTSTSGPIIDAIVQALEAVVECLTIANTHRWLRRVSPESRAITFKKHQKTLEKLKEAQKQYPQASAKRLLYVHSHLFDDKGNLISDGDTSSPMIGLMMSCLWQEKILNLAAALIDLLTMTSELENTRVKSTLWLPKSLQRIFVWGLQKEGVPSTVNGTGILQEPMTSSRDEKKKRRPRKNDEFKNKNEIPSSKASAEAQLMNMRCHTGRRRHAASRVLVNLLRWFGNTEGIFALRVMIVTIVLACPAVIKSTAGFYYREKGIWALIMAQLSLVPHTSDFISGVIARLLGTILGGVVGLVSWYIGAGNGPGNPYGIAAIMAVVIINLMWFRLFAPPQYTAASIMVAATTYLVVAYSWDDTHIPHYGNPGVGYNVFWRRILLVLIGFAVATIVMFIPHPPSGGRHYRQILGASLGSVKDRYALFVSNWQSPPPDFIGVVEREAAAEGEVLISLVGPISLTRFEFTTSNIDTDTLREVDRLSIRLNQYITQLLLYSTQLPLHLRKRFIRTSGATTETLISKIMAVLTLVQLSIRSGDSLPALLPTPLLGRSFDFRCSENDPENEQEHLSLGRNLGTDPILKYISAVNAFVHLLGTIDDLIIVVKKAVGETSDITAHV